MKRTLSISLLLPLLLPVSVSAQTVPAMMTYISQVGRFSIKFPSHPAVTINKPNKSVPGDLGSTDCKADLGASSFDISFGDLTPARMAAGTAAILDNAQAQLKRSSKGKMISEKKLTLGNWPGREQVVEIDSHLGARARFFLIGHRIYTLWYIGSPQSINSPSVDAFFTSFKIRNHGTLPAAFKPLNMGGTTVKIPGEPKPRTGTTSDNTEMHVWQSMDPATRVVYIAGHGGVKTPAATPEEREKILDNSREGTIAGLGAKLVEERWITVGDCPGRELVLKVMQDDIEIGVAVSRNIYFKGELVQLMVISQTAAGLGTSHVDEFMDSLSIGNK